MNATNTARAFETPDPIQIHDFEQHPVRVVMIDNQPWFVASDVCRALNIQNTTQAVQGLDDDEYTMFNIGYSGAGRGNPNANVLSLPGLLTLTLRCRDAMTPGTVPHRFRKWVTGEVLPAILRTGSYSLPGMSAPVFEDADTARLSAALGVVREGRRLWGLTAARRLWAKVGLPDPGVMPEIDKRPETDDELVYHAIASRDDGTGITRIQFTSLTRDMGRARRNTAVRNLTDAGRIRVEKVRAQGDQPGGARYFALDDTPVEGGA